MAVFRAAASAAARGLAASNFVQSSSLMSSLSSRKLTSVAARVQGTAMTMMMVKGSMRSPLTSAPFSSLSFSSAAATASAAAAATAARRASSSLAASAHAAAPSATSFSSFAANAAAAAATATARRASSSSPSSSFFPFSSFRRSHLDFPRRESLLQRLFGRGSSGNYDDGQTVLYSLIALNVGIYALWQVNPTFARRHFVVSAAALADGRLHTLVTSAFSHRDGMSHLAVNMVSLFFFGRSVGGALGGRALLSLYLAAGTG